MSKSLLKLPSVILQEAGVKTRREYAAIVYRCLQQTENESNDTQTSYKNQEHAKQFDEHVRKRMNMSIPCDKSEECIILPPLFWQSQEYFMRKLTPQLFLVCYEQGPIVPVVRLHASQNIMSDRVLLDFLIRIYEALHKERATKKNMEEVLNKTQ